MGALFMDHGVSSGYWGVDSCRAQKLCQTLPPCHEVLDAAECLETGISHATTIPQPWAHCNGCGHSPLTRDHEIRYELSGCPASQPASQSGHRTFSKRRSHRQRNRCNSGMAVENEFHTTSTLSHNFNTFTQHTFTQLQYYNQFAIQSGIS
jgi:hypothetical protein